MILKLLQFLLAIVGGAIAACVGSIVLLFVIVAAFSKIFLKFLVVSLFVINMAFTFLLVLTLYYCYRNVEFVKSWLRVLPVVGQYV